MTDLELDVAWRRIKPLLHQRFRDFIPAPDISQMRKNKGRAGLLLEQAIGLRASSKLLDFRDGDLKTYKSDPSGYPRETMAIHQLNPTELDKLVSYQPFLESSVHAKTRRMIVVAICKDEEDPADWLVAHGATVDAQPGTDWFRRLEESYDDVVAQFQEHISSGDGRFHTSNGCYMQLRTKDSKPYTPLYSSLLKRELVNKRIAFYFKKLFMEELLSLGFAFHKGPRSRR